MIGLGNVLIVDDSTIYRDLMATVMGPYSDVTLTAASAREAIAQLESRGDIDLVLCDVVMKDGDGFQVLEYVGSMGASTPMVAMVTAFPQQDAAERAFAMGAVAYLTKPTTVRKILTAVGLTGLRERREINTRCRCSGKAYLLEEGHPSDGLFAWDIYNLGPGGAFLETKGPLPLGAELDLLLEIAGEKARVTARVVRVQEPSWIDVGGVGVSFVETSAGLERLLETALRDPQPEEATGR